MSSTHPQPVRPDNPRVTGARAGKAAPWSAMLATGLPPLSDDALRLHAYAVVVSATIRRPGFVPDEMLAALPPGLSRRAKDLHACGLWTRVSAGYLVERREFLRAARALHGQYEQLLPD